MKRFFFFECIWGIREDGTVVYFHAPKKGDVEWSTHQTSADNVYGRSHTYCTCETRGDQAACTIFSAVDTVKAKVAKIEVSHGQLSESYISSQPKVDTIQYLKSQFPFSVQL